jgi:uncharacterized protein VirK/YbjX
MEVNNMLTLEQALQFNKALAIKTNRQDARQIKRWYAQGYYMGADGMWYNSNGSRKYYTGN